jgi:heme oxygenase
VDASLLPGLNDPSIILAQNNKQIRKRIAGLQANIDQHKKKLDKDPDCQASNHWRNEISAAEAAIARLRLRLPNGR